MKRYGREGSVNFNLAGAQRTTEVVAIMGDYFRGKEDMKLDTHSTLTS